MARRVYDLEFKKDVVRLLLESGKSISSLSKDVGVPTATIHRWKDELLTNGAVKIDKAVLEQSEELKKLRKLNAELQMERDILKKALAIFSAMKK